METTNIQTTCHVVHGLGLSDLNNTLQINADPLDPDAGHASHGFAITYPVQEDGICVGMKVAAEIHFQHGTVKEVGINGATEEALISILIHRLQQFNNGPFKCRENSLAITKLEEAVHWLNARTMDRLRRGVEGQHKE